MLPEGFKLKELTLEDARKLAARLQEKRGGVVAVVMARESPTKTYTVMRLPWEAVGPVIEGGLPGEDFDKGEGGEVPYSPPPPGWQEPDGTVVKG